MRIREGISVAIAAIYANKLRSLLTMLGIIIGVASVLAMIAIGDGAKTIVLEEARKQGGVNQFTMYCVNIKKVGDVWVANRSNEYFRRRYLIFRSLWRRLKRQYGNGIVTKMISSSYGT